MDNSSQQQGGNSLENPFSVSYFNREVGKWVDRLGFAWVEGQLAQIDAQPKWAYAYMTLRDIKQDISVPLMARYKDFEQWKIEKGDHVVVYGKPNFYSGRGRFSLQVHSLQKVGLGLLLARIEELRQRLIAAGYCAPERKKPLPFLPNTIGLITGANSAAEADVHNVARRRWPEVKFRTINTQVQGTVAASQVIDALQILDADPEVDVIIIARGGGSVEDLLPFSDEDLAMAVVQAHTPVVSAIGHEPDHPVLDDVADVRAATPTDAAKTVVPDVVAERQWLADAHDRLRAALRGWVDREQEIITGLRSRPAFAQPLLTLDQYSREIDMDRGRIQRAVMARIESESHILAGLKAQVANLGPTATLERGYAIVQVGSPPSEVVDTVDKVHPGSQLRIRVIDGAITAAAMQVESKK